MSRVYIGRLPTRCSERDVEKFFKGYGRLKDVVLKNGYGFVEFDNEKDADDAVYDLRGRELGGERIIVEHARLPSDSRGGIRRGIGGRDRRFGPPTRTEYRVIVENLSSRVSWQYLKDMMRKAGDVTYADAHKTARNDGVVEFSSNADMKEAIEKFNGYELYGRRLRVYEDKPRRSRSNSRRSASSGRERKYSHRSRSRDSYRRRKSQSPRGRRDRSTSSDRRNSESRVRSESPDAKSRSGSRQSESRVRERSTSHRSAERSIDRDSRSPSRNGRNGNVGDEVKQRTRSKSGSGDRSRSQSRSPSTRSPARSRTPSASRSRSVSRHSPSDSERHNEQSSNHEDDKNAADSE